MDNEFVTFIKSKKEFILEMFDKPNDQYLDKYKCKFLHLKIGSKEKKNNIFKGADHNLLKNNIFKNIMVEPSEKVNLTKSAEQHIDMSNYTINEELLNNDLKNVGKIIDDSYKKMANEMDNLRRQIVDTITKRIRSKSVYIYNDFFKKKINVKDTLFYAYEVYKQNTDIHIFNNVVYKINDFDNNKANNIVVELTIDANTTSDYFNQIIKLISDFIDKVNIGGNLLLYFFFAPWRERFEPLLNLLLSNFEIMNVYYPLCILTYTNRVVYICNNKKKIKNADNELEKYYSNLLLYSKKITYYAMYSYMLMRYMMLQDVNGSPVVDVMINKIITRFNNLPDTCTIE